MSDFVSRRLVVPLPWRKPPLAQNDRQHHMAKAKAFAAVKDEARYAIRAQRLPRLERVAVSLHYAVPDLRRRDADGPAPTLKAVLDALVAERVIPDDSWQHVPHVSIAIHPPPAANTPPMWLTLTTLEETP